MKRPQILRRALGGTVLAVALAGAGCVPEPPSVPAPTLPAGVGVRWHRDTGGTLMGEEGYYSPSLVTSTVLDGVVTGPDPGEPGSLALPPTLLERIGLVGAGIQLAPDGSARSPWNGFAGEGITLVATDPTDGDWTLHFPGGSCRMATVGPGYQIQMVSPSPDGTKVAFRNIDFDGGSKVEVQRLVDGPTCPPVTSAQYSADSDTPTSAGNTLVWAADSSAVTFAVGRGAGSSSVARLPASAGATADDLVGPTSGLLVPLGWSVADRLLYSRTRIEGDRAVSRLITRAVSGGAERVLDTAASPVILYPEFPLLSSPPTRGAHYAWLHYGYFVPGTTSIVYNDGSSSATDGDGSTFPRFHVALIADADDASAKPILGAKPPLTWHPEVRSDDFDPPYDDTIDVPNAEYLDRFVR